MKNLNGAFLFITLLAWCMTESIFRATEGHSTALLLFVIGFLVIFATLGCLNLSDKTTNLIGAVATVLLSVSLIFFTVNGMLHGASWVTSAAKSFGAILSVVLAVSAVSPTLAAKSQSHA